MCFDEGLQRKSNFYERDPLLVLENIFAISVPILAENICEFTGVNVNLESMEEVANCFKFTCSMLCHNRTYGGQVHRDYLTKMLTVAKGRVNLPEDPSLVKVSLFQEIMFFFAFFFFSQFSSITFLPFRNMLLYFN